MERKNNNVEANEALVAVSLEWFFKFLFALCAFYNENWKLDIIRDIEIINTIWPKSTPHAHTLAQNVSQPIHLSVFLFTFFPSNKKPQNMNKMVCVICATDDYCLLRLCVCARNKQCSLPIANTKHRLVFNCSDDREQFQYWMRALDRREGHWKLFNGHFRNHQSVNKFLDLFQIIISK